ncbi:MAG: hypothetical protein Q9160_003758 [Pyrenula sp. 1 TL-2023]
MRGMAPDSAGNARRSDRPTTRFSLRVLHQSLEESSDLSSHLSSPLSSTTSKSPLTRSSNSSESSPPRSPQNPTGTGLKLKFRFSKAPSLLSQELRSVRFRKTPEIKVITPNQSSSEESLSSVQAIQSKQTRGRSPSLLRPDERDEESSFAPITLDDHLKAANNRGVVRGQTTDIESGGEMAGNGKPKLKLSFVQSSKPDLGSGTASAPDSATTPGGPLKLKLNINKGTTTPVESTPPKSKSKKKSVQTGTTPGSSAKKRKISQANGNGESLHDEVKREKQQPIKKVRIVHDVKTPTTPAAQMLKIKHKGKVPKRPPGSGYDSELDEREDDPTIHEGLIFRVLPGEDADIIRKAIEENKIGVPRSEGGLDLRFTAFATNGRRGLVEVRGKKYATVVVDLPCIIEGMKSWDKKGWIKSVDVSQMLVVLGPCDSVEKAQEYPLPTEVDKDFKYAHGITPPMKNVRKRRFNRTKRTSLSAIEAVERRVNQLLADDEAALESTYEYVDLDRMTQDPSRAQSTAVSEDEEEDEEDIDEDAEGDEDADGYPDAQDDLPAQTPAYDEDEDIDMDLMERMLEDDDGTTAANATHGAANDTSFAATSGSASSAAVTPSQTPHNQTEDDGSGDDSESDEDAMDDGENATEAADRQELREKLQEIEQSLTKHEEDFKRATNPFLKNKMEPKIKSLRETRAQLREELGIDE